MKFRRVVRLCDFRVNQIVLARIIFGFGKPPPPASRSNDAIDPAGRQAAAELLLDPHFPPRV